MAQFEVSHEIEELKNQFSYSKNIGFFFGAGTSCALGIPSIQLLTNKVKSILDKESSEVFSTVEEDLSNQIEDRSVNIEDVLNQLRRIREITSESEDKKYIGICGKSALNVDNNVCRAIYQVIMEHEAKASFSITKRFFAWYNLLNRDYAKEIFTTNYDLIIEKALETSEIPYFDGFVGSYEPFFWQESVEHLVKPGDLSKNWIRLWKMHGSLNWSWRYSETTKTNRIVRVGNIGSLENIENELVIYPSKDKYTSSRKQPFIAYFDRMRAYLLSGELLFIISGYSFSDQHINEVIFNCMRQNNRLFVIAFMYEEEEIERLYELSSMYLNLSAYGPKSAIINGVRGEWLLKDGEGESTEDMIGGFWDRNDSQLKLGDFKELVAFLVTSSGKEDYQDWGQND